VSLPRLGLARQRLDRRRLLTGLVGSGPSSGVRPRSRAPGAGGADALPRLRVATSVENVLVDAYTSLLAAPALARLAGGGRLRALLTLWGEHHRDHGAALGQLTADLGGTREEGREPTLAVRLASARSGTLPAGEALALLLELEAASTATHQANVGLLGEQARTLSAAIAGVEAQHATLLRLAAGLQGAGAVDRLDPVTDPADYPPGVARAALPPALEAGEGGR